MAHTQDPPDEHLEYYLSQIMEGEMTVDDVEKQIKDTISEDADADADEAQDEAGAAEDDSIPPVGGSSDEDPKRGLYSVTTTK